MKNVLLLGCAYPPELPYFTRGLAQIGARVFGVDHPPENQLPALTRESLNGYLQAVRRAVGSTSFDRVEALWEPTVLLAARLREELGAPGLRYEQAVRFRDKDKMKQVVAEAGVRTARHQRARVGKECFEAAERIGFPICLKPIAGAGSTDTFRVETRAELESVLRKAGHVGEFNVEEFIEGEEFTFDTISIDGKIHYESISWYRPPPLIGRSVEWISPQTVTLRDTSGPEFADGKVLGKRVLDVLGQETGFAHMEWYRKKDGTAVFGEIAARPPGAHSVDTMNFASDIDLFTGWADAVVNGAFNLEFERLYNCAVVFKRAQGQGRIDRIEGLDRILSSFGEHIAAIDLLPIGAHRRDWVKTLLSDGFVFVRHPDLNTTVEMANRIGTDLQMYAG
jgi:carbamoyl-phosphate synthase L subunit-like protein